MTMDLQENKNQNPSVSLKSIQYLQKEKRAFTGGYTVMKPQTNDNLNINSNNIDISIATL